MPMNDVTYWSAINAVANPVETFLKLAKHDCLIIYQTKHARAFLPQKVTKHNIGPRHLCGKC